MSDNPIATVTQERAAIYLRYSCDMSRPASLEDQERNCREYAQQQGWVVLDEFVRSDIAKTGKTLRHREMLESLRAEAEQIPRPFDVLMVDEGSRLTRKLRDALEIAEMLKFVGVKLVIVNRRLHSDDPSFPSMLTLTGMIDEQNSELMRHRVRRGQEGRVRNGFAPGGRCYGYKNVPIANAAHPELHGRAGIEGYKAVVYEPEAATIRRIFGLFADGLSMSDIMKKLNRERVLAPGKSAIGPDLSCWRESAVKRILKNEKYIGVRTWRKTYQTFHPVTGKTVTRKNPPEQWIRTKVDDLRIVPDELWMRAQERLKIVNEKMTRQRVGGLKRAKNRVYLFSGLLECAVCGSPMNISSSGPGYVCSSWRHRGGCTNSLWFREDRLTSQLIAALTSNLLVPEVMDYFVDAVSRDFEKYVKANPYDDEDSFEGLEKRVATLKQNCGRIIEAMMNPLSQNSTFLPQKLAELESELATVQTRQKLLDAPKTLDDAKLDIAATVKSNVSNLLEIIKQDAPKAQEVLQRRIKKLRMFPTMTADGPAYEVYGEIDLFTPPTGRKKSVLLACSDMGTGQQYTSEVDFVFRFVGLMVYPHVEVDHPLIQPLSELLAAAPALLHEPKLATDWTMLLKSYVRPTRHVRFTKRYVRTSLRDWEDKFMEHFGMTTIYYRGKTWYMFSQLGPTTIPQLEGMRLTSPAERATIEPVAEAA